VQRGKYRVNENQYFTNTKMKMMADIMVTNKIFNRCKQSINSLKGRLVAAQKKSGAVVILLTS
jgi:hypothetical protein